MDRYELKSARFLAREALDRAIHPGDTVIDATMGNGHDTQFLCEKVGPSGRVFAFDIQEQAVRSTEARLLEAGLSGRAVLIHDSHELMVRYVSCLVSAVVFNLGWLPGGDHRITTRPESTMAAVSAALDLLRPGGVLVLCVYPGHSEGEQERKEIIRFFSSLSNREYNVLRQQFLNASAGAPECLIAQRLFQ